MPIKKDRNKTKKAHVISTCKAATESGCKVGLPIGDSFLSELENAVQATGWPAFLIQNAEKIHHHNQFKITVAGCANGCSRPHIADVAFIKACIPGVDDTMCTHCGMCVDRCPDKAISMPQDLPVFDNELCLKCGACVMECPVDAISCVQEGWRVLVGGRLGRKPRLAVELPGIFTQERALNILDDCLKFYMKGYAPKRRFDDVLFDQGVEAGLNRLLA